MDKPRFKLALPFLWVQISPWEGHEAATSTHQLPDMRLAQMAANRQLAVGCKVVFMCPCIVNFTIANH